MGRRCAADLPADPAQPIALRAEPASGSVFTGRTGPCVGVDPCALALSGPLTVSASFEAGPTCSARTCWEHPLPQGNSLLGVSALSATDVWAVGRRGAIRDDLWLAGDGGVVLQRSVVRLGDVRTIGRPDVKPR